MKTSGKVRLFIGIVTVFIIVGLLTVWLNASMSTSSSIKAELDAQARSVGTDYSGLVVKQEVEEGQSVKENDLLFEIDSQQLKQSLANGTVKAESLTVKLNPDNKNVQLRANNSGVIDEIMFREGAYVPGNAVVATMYVVDSLFVKAHFQLSPNDYARIEKGTPMEVLFPDNTRKEATITTVNLESSEDKENVDTVITAKITDVDMSDFRFTVGTPVNATLHLKQNAWYQDVFTFVQRLFTPQES
jgi:multidrug resistance efflux pump